MNLIRIGSLVLVLLACGRQSSTTVGQVQDCDNGTYFSLKTQSCQALWGYQALTDAKGFERIHIYNGVTVPRKINGRSPFLVTVAYNISRPATIEISMKQVMLGAVGGDSLSDWHKYELEPGSGVLEVVLKPNYDLPAGRAAAYIDGRWAIDSGYIIEVKGGDRFEDEDADRLSSWRVAGIQVDPEALDDPSNQTLILGSMAAPEQLVSCQPVSVKLPVERINFNANFQVSLKKPANGWENNGEQFRWVKKGFTGTLEFQFLAKKVDTGECASPGAAAVRDEKREYKDPGSYLLQLDVFRDGNKLNPEESTYIVPEASHPVAVASAS